MSQPNEQDLQSIFSIVWERRKIAFSVTALTIVAGIAYTVFAPSVWEAKATIVFPVRTPSILGAGTFEQSGLAATLSGGPTQLKIFGGMLESDRALGYISNMSDLSRRDIKEMRTLQDQPNQNSISISARSIDAGLAKKVVGLHIEALTKINNSVNKPLVSDDAQVLKKQLDAQRQRLIKSENLLLAFQQTAQTAPSIGTSGGGKDSSIIANSGRWNEMLRTLELQYVTLDSSIKDAQSRLNQVSGSVKDLPATLPPVEKWRGKLIELEYELKVKEITLASEAPELVKLRKTISITKGELQAELSKYTTAANAGMINTSALTQRVSLEAQLSAVKRLAKLAPSEAIKLSQLTRDVTTQSSIVQQLETQFQLASLQANRDPNHWEVLDEPRVDEKAVNKSFSKNGILSLLAGCALGTLAAMFAPQRKRKANGSEPEITISKAA
ncbi:MAG: Wzz/FepE/Etk N-terminal domain-containing protein [Armatimonadota bacterium]